MVFLMIIKIIVEFKNEWSDFLLNFNDEFTLNFFFEYIPVARLTMSSKNICQKQKQYLRQNKKKINVLLIFSTNLIFAVQCALSGNIRIQWFIN